jgi:RimJ/RimL family protein N-acetyltransferase
MRPILETERLALRELTLDDLDFVAEMLAHPEVMRYYPKCLSREESHEWIERQLARYAWRGHSLWLATERGSGDPIGQIGLIPQIVDGAEEPEIGYLVHYPYWRRGYASEAAAAVRDYAFRTLGKPYVISLIRPENVPSQGVARKIGMSPSRRTTFHGYEHIVFSSQ